MSLRSLARLSLVGFTLAAILLVGSAASAAPNYYSQGSTTKVEARMSIASPKGGKFEPGGALSIGWTKQTDGTDVSIWLYTASGDGIRGDKVRGIIPSQTAATAFTTRGGSFNWTIPEDLVKGRYVVVISSGLDEATSPSFMITEPPIKLTAPRVEKVGTLKVANVDGKGKGSIKVTINDTEVEFSWGSGLCPSLVGGLPGALVTLAGLGQVTLVPIVRDVTRKDKVEQTCLDGFVIVAPPPRPPPAPATPPEMVPTTPAP